MLTKLTVVTSSQYVDISNRYAVHLKLNAVCQLYLYKTGKET